MVLVAGGVLFYWRGRGYRAHSEGVNLVKLTLKGGGAILRWRGKKKSGRIDRGGKAWCRLRQF